MDPVSKTLQAILLWQVMTLTRSQFLQQMPQMPQMQFPGMGMGPPMGGMMPPPQMQMPPLPPMPIGLSHPKLPVVVMPYHSKHLDKKQRSKKKSHKKRRRRRRRKETEESYESDTDTDSSCSEDNTRRSGRRSSVKRRHQVLTPVISYVTKDGYVVYQKKIKKERAKEWLELGKNKQPEDQRNLVEDTSGEDSGLSEETIRDLKYKYKQERKRDRRDRRH